MDKGDPGSHAARAGDLVHQPDTLGTQLRKHPVDVIHLDGDVVEGRPSSLQKPCDHAFAGGLERLQVHTLTEREHSLDEALPLLDMVHAEAQHPTERSQGPRFRAVRKCDVVETTDTHGYQPVDCTAAAGPATAEGPPSATATNAEMAAIWSSRTLAI